MKRFIGFAFVFLLFTNFAELPKLRFDGLYSCKGDGYVSYIRFYEDGNVLTASSTGTVDEVKRWMCLDTFKVHEWHSRGGWRMKEDQISFASTSSSGTVQYEGTIVNDSTLHLFIHSLINDHRSEHDYHLAPVEEWKK